METEQHHYELRSRSRSRSQTPLILNQPIVELESPEHHYDLRNKSRERSNTPAEITSSRRSGSKSLPGSASKVRDQSMETIIENKEDKEMNISVGNQNKRLEEKASISTKRVERRSERQKAKKQIFANGQDEGKKDLPDCKSERKRKSVSKKMLTSDYSSEEGEREDIPSRPGSAYEIYKQAGDWWNVFPKTDYTYSSTSQCRYEIAPGIIAMPNMSRRSIHSDASSSISSAPSVSQQNLSQSSQETAESGLGDSVDIGELKETGYKHQGSMDIHSKLHSPLNNQNSLATSTVYKKMHIEQYRTHKEVIYTDPSEISDFRQRFFAWSSNSSSQYDQAVDSDMELDEAVPVTMTEKQRWRVISWFRSLATIITFWFNKSLEFLKLKTVRKREYYTSYNYNRYKESRWTSLWRSIDYYSQHLYLLLVRVLLLDSWLLSRLTGLRKRVQEKGPKILWITLLPLLLLVGWAYLSYIVPFFSSTKINERGVQVLLPPNIHLSENRLDAKDFANGDAMELLEKLNNKINELGDTNTYQFEYLSNVSHVIEEERQSNINMWKQYEEKITSLQNKLNEQTSKINDQSEINAIRSEFKTIQDLYLQLKTCCNNAQPVLNEDIEAQVEKVISNYFGIANGKKNLAEIVENIILSHSTKEQTTSLDTQSNKLSDITDEQIRKIVKEMLKVYDADKTGRVDYALESAGGQIISTRCTQRYDVKSRAFKLLGFTLYHESNNPRTVIQGNPIQPGACWAFQDFPGYLLIKLRSFIRVTGFTIEHAPRSILPNREMSSAPRKFVVQGLTSENDPDPVLFGEYEFLNSDENLQYFPVQHEMTTPYEYIELRVDSNHGQLEYTCLYRFRVHGLPV